MKQSNHSFLGSLKTPQGCCEAIPLGWRNRKKLNNYKIVIVLLTCFLFIGLFLANKRFVYSQTATPTEAPTPSPTTSVPTPTLTTAPAPSNTPTQPPSPTPTQSSPTQPIKSPTRTPTKKPAQSSPTKTPALTSTSTPTPTLEPSPTPTPTPKSFFSSVGGKPLALFLIIAGLVVSGVSFYLYRKKMKGN